MADRALCLEPVELSGRERSVLRSVVARGSGSSLSCELEAGHGHEHAASVEDGWWLRWWPGRRVLESRAACAIAADGGERCRVPAGHEGGHSFDLAVRPDGEAADQVVADAGWPGGRR
jgi:hypothetical protein